MDVIGDSAHGECGRFICPGDTAKVRPKTILDFRRKNRLPAFCAPHAMIKAA
jgi:hypothetical protein